LDHVARRLVFGAYYQSGQSCISVQRILVHRAVARELVDALVTRVRALRAGDPHDEATDIGPVIDDDAADRIEAWIEEARDAGARVL
ncbi:aldehyde dehydrogenase family protein, partial [Escherichia coli]|nr:aldehyde dehydrogenase family protein [Escherichia coli]